MNRRHKYKTGTFDGQPNVTLESVEGVTYVVHVFHLLTGDVGSIGKGERGI
jgi:hypothetical protein